MKPFATCFAALGLTLCSALAQADVAQHAADAERFLKLARADRLTLPVYAQVQQMFAQRFAEAGLSPDIVLSAIDADVIKTYVETGLGVGIIAEMAFDPPRDVRLKRLDIDPLFAVNTTRLALRRGRYLRSYVYRFIRHFAPALQEETVARQIKMDLDNY